MTAPRTLLTGLNIQAKKQLGQNFLSDPSAAEMIVRRAAIQEGDIVVEIGAGLGALTVPAARRAEHVVAVETDRRLTGLLKTELTVHGIDNVTILETDILKLNVDGIPHRGTGRLRVIGNLPYNISSQILVWLIGNRNAFETAVFMFQKELARRLTAPPGVKEYGRITVMVQYCMTVEKVADIPATVFFPRPKVDSEVLRLDIRHAPPHRATDEAALFRLIKAAFSKRRKTLKNALAASELHMTAEDAGRALLRAGIDPVRRAETLTVEEFVRLGNVLSLEQSIAIRGNENHFSQ